MEGEGVGGLEAEVFGVLPGQLQHALCDAGAADVGGGGDVGAPYAATNAGGDLGVGVEQGRGVGEPPHGPEVGLAQVGGVEMGGQLQQIGLPTVQINL